MNMFSLSMFIVIPLLAFSQWVDDPSVNTFVSGSGLDHTYPKMAATQGTKFYPDMSDLSEDIFVATWNENRDSPFDADGSVYAQNISGEESLIKWMVLK
ncbi:MAG: hypothetical protein ISS17_01620 [Bacteroidales bacterium]|nr:hypothetical protein [Bacteroidales bacterium]